MRLTPKLHAMHTLDTGNFLRVFVDDKDVTNDCFLADDKKGIAKCLVRTPSGKIQASPDGPGPLVIRMTGRVEFRPVPATPEQIESARLMAED